MSGKIHDPNLLKNFKETTETDWYEVAAENLDIHGLIKDKEGSLWKWSEKIFCKILI